METLGDKKTAKNCSKFHCNFCDYTTSKKSSFGDHLSTDKHKKRSLGDAGDAKADFQPFSEKQFSCDHCGKTYSSRNGIWKHKKNCFEIIKEEQKEDLIDKDLILLLLNLFSFKTLIITI
jgi:ribosomal protein L37AE/L43A